MPRKNRATTRSGRVAQSAASRITNGTQLLPGVDGRSGVARRMRDILGQIVADQGGSGEMSEVRTQLARRFAAGAVLCEEIEARVCRGEQIEIQDHAVLTSSLVRLSARLGLDRRMRNLTPTLRDYLEATAQERQAQEAARRAEALDLGDADDDDGNLIEGEATK